jgi:hypothetical protein
MKDTMINEKLEMEVFMYLVLCNSWIQLSLRNKAALNESLSQWMYFKCGALAFIPDKSEPDIDRESDTMTYIHRGALSRRNF